jgi:hypothetical protein
VKNDKHHLQLRLSAQIRKELNMASKRLKLPAADVVRSALFFGLPMLLAVNEMQGELLKRLVKKIKGEARLQLSRQNARRKPRPDASRL